MSKPLIGNIKKIAIHKVGEIGNNKRIWIANQNLFKSFNIGDALTLTYNEKEREIIAEKAEVLGTHTISYRGKEQKTPILDIKNKNVRDTFGDVEKVEVRYYKDKIVIKATKQEVKKTERAQKNGLNTFELFAGGGTFTYFFKKAGFNIKGALELVGKYLTVFEKNHNENIYTIQSAIEDIDINDYPTDIDCLLAGIPCDSFTPQNVHLNNAKRNNNTDSATEKDLLTLEKKRHAEALTFHVLMAIKQMNPKTVVVEEVVGYSKEDASYMLRTILKQMGYKLSETISESTHTSRKRWILVANMNETISLDNLIKDDGKVLMDFIDLKKKQTEWKSPQGHVRVNAMLKKESIGLRAYDLMNKKLGTMPKNWTGHTIPVLKHPTREMYADLSVEDVKNIHGLSGMELSGVKTTDREILGQGVADVFLEVAKRIKKATLKSLDKNVA